MNGHLDDLGLVHMTDKSSAYHNYLNRLEKYFDSQPRPLKILEIGVLDGRSIKTWLDYFPDSQVYGIDTRPFHSVSDDRFTFYNANAANPHLWPTLGSFNIIIDDGSHSGGDVIMAYDHGFSHVLPGGIWVIEDTCAANYNVIDIMRPTINELQGHNISPCGNPNVDFGRMSFVHFYKGFVVIGKR